MKDKRYAEIGESMGLHSKNSGKHGKDWVLKNTHERRAVTDKIDQALQRLAAKHDSQGSRRPANEMPPKG